MWWHVRSLVVDLHHLSVALCHILRHMAGTSFIAQKACMYWHPARPVHGVTSLACTGAASELHKCASPYPLLGNVYSHPALLVAALLWVFQPAWGRHWLCQQALAAPGMHKQLATGNRSCRAIHSQWQLCSRAGHTASLSATKPKPKPEQELVLLACSCRWQSPSLVCWKPPPATAHLCCCSLLTWLQPPSLPCRLQLRCGSDCQDVKQICC